MDFNFTPENAAQLLAIVSPFAVIVAGYVFTKTDWNKVAKSALVFAIAALLASLKAYADGGFVDNFWTNLTQIYTLSQIGFWTLMKAAGLESYFAPKDALVSKASDEVAKQIDAQVSTETAKSILDSNSSSTLDVTATVVDQNSDTV